MRAFFAAALVASGLISSVAAGITNPVDPLVIKGSKIFFKSNGTQFFMRGVAYQQDYSGGGANGNGSATGTNYVDPLADSASCKRDVPLLAALGTNIIRTYAVDPTQNHDTCMQLLNDAGIYVISDLSDPTNSINRDDPQWNDNLYARYTSVIDNLSQYNNVLGFFAGNEVSNAKNNTADAAFVKAAVRDMKAYIKAQNYRAMGVGYATSDDADIRVDIADYMNCGDASTSVDFWGYNIYSWCGDSTYETSGYADRTKEFASFNVPVFFAEYGCNNPAPRTFSEVQAIYGSNMTQVFSGGIVYMYFQEANDYGLVSISGNTASKLPDYTNLQSQLAKATPTGVKMDAYNPTNSAQACPTDSGWQASASPLPPTPNAELCECMMASLECNVASNVATTKYGSLFGTVCGFAGKPCAGINTNLTNGAYGAYGMCNSTQQLAFAFNSYYQSQKKNANACNFNGAATTQSSSSPSGTCSQLLSEAGTAGTGTVTSSPTGTGGSSSGSGSSGSSSSSKGAGSALAVHHVSFGVLGLSMYVFAAVASGAAMIFL
ncbi:carbohydrate-binding module family 43 protein [Myriangium duriaei CBS 260.36]|uniref:1,3-beta-glucanosyltransferase n=1 Tax=Myriangium duriaei CBS 260.36 TaxID=1168546 RepID=A0A9P4JEA7_9PEZI|nr:carbohydrate-binding module family 43 protein [Myriangium duriaei CBS 260.36]